MTLTLHLGVLDQPYTNDKESGVTTGDVAEFLEAKYHPMETFSEVHMEDLIIPSLEDGIRGSLESLLMGAPPSLNVFGTATDKIRKGFDDFITNKEMESLGIPGVPTKAALDRRSARFKKGKARRQRPSFVDTGLYLDSFMAWVD